MNDAARPDSVIRRHPILRLGLVLLSIPIVSFAALYSWIVPTHVQQAPPYVEVVTTRCLGPDGIPVGEEFGQPCPSGTTVDTVVIQSHLQTGQP
jgi:hypothetical protein